MYVYVHQKMFKLCSLMFIHLFGLWSSSELVCMSCHRIKFLYADYPTLGGGGGRGEGGVSYSFIK